MSTFAPTTKTALESAITAWLTSGGSTTIGSATASYNAVQINSWDVSAITDMSYIFFNNGFNSNISNWNVSNVVNMTGMFQSNSSFNQPLNSWNVGNVTNMYYLFNGATAFNQPLDSWNVSKVSNMSGMFQSASAFNQPINSWNVSNVNNTRQMFYIAVAFNQPLNSWNVTKMVNASDMFYRATAFNGDISNWNTMVCTNMDNMLRETSAFNQNISRWNVRKVTSMNAMFLSATAFNQNIKTWSVVSCTNFTGMFNGATMMNTYQGAPNATAPTSAYFNEATVNTLATGYPVIIGKGSLGTILSINTSAIYDYDNISSFSYQWKRNGVDINLATGATYTTIALDVNELITVTVSYTDGHGTAETMTSLAIRCNTLPTGSISISGTAAVDQILTLAQNIADFNGLGAISYQWNRDNVAVLGANGTTYAVTLLDLYSKLTVTASYTDQTGCFESLTSAATVNVPHVGIFTPQTKATLQTALTAWFAGATTATVIYDDINTWDVSAITDMDSLFANKTTFNSNISNWNVSQVTNMSNMFSGAIAFNQPIGSWNTMRVTQMNSTFKGATVFNQDISNWNVSKVTSMANTFQNAIAFNQNIRKWYVASVTSFSYMLSGATAMIASQGATSPTTSAWFNQVPANSAPVGLPTISGTAEQFKTLTAVTTGITDADGLGVFSYVWKRGGVDISNATSATYPLIITDVGQTITVTVSYFDGHGTTQTLTSAPTATVAPRPNTLPGGSLTISGNAVQNQTLSLYENKISDVDGLGQFTWQWKSNGINIDGATGTSYTLKQAEVGKTITLTAYYTDGFNVNESFTSDATMAVTNVNDVPTGSLTITPSTPSQGQTLSIATNSIADVDGLGVIAWQWKSNGSNINGATGTTYVLTQGEVGKTITLTASYQDVLGANEIVVSNTTTAVANVNDLPSGTVTISGIAEQKQTLTVSNTLFDTDGPATLPVSYQWKSNGVAIPLLSTGTSYLLTQAEVGKYITVTASYTDGFSMNESVTSAATAAVANFPDDPVGRPVINGTRTQGFTLTADATGISDLDGLGVFTYNWVRNPNFNDFGGVQVQSSLSNTYILTQADVGNYMYVRVVYTDSYNATQSAGSNVALETRVENVNDAPTGAVTIAGTVKQGFTLTASNNLVDPDGTGGAVSYAWKRNGISIVDANSSTYLLTELDVDSKMSVVASYTDGGGYPNNIISAETVAVENVNDALNGSVSISGTAEQKQTLTAVLSTPFTDGDGPATLAVSYKWKRNGVEISGATASTYLLDQADVG